MHTRLQSSHARQGFTLVELLIVVVVIGILAGVGLPMFKNARDGAVEATVKTDVSAGVSAALVYYQQNANTFVGITPALVNWTASPSNVVKYTSPAADSVLVQASNAGAGATGRRCQRIISFKSGNSALACSAGVY